jgi:hypothetical protein
MDSANDHSPIPHPGGDILNFCVAGARSESIPNAKRRLLPFIPPQKCWPPIGIGGRRHFESVLVHQVLLVVVLEKADTGGIDVAKATAE